MNEKIKTGMFHQMDKANIQHYTSMTKEQLERIASIYIGVPEEQDKWSYYTAIFNEEGEYISFSLDNDNMFTTHTLPSGITISMQRDPMHVKEDHVLFLEPLRTS